MTIILDNNSNFLNSLPSLKYDLISVQPNSEKTFIAICGNVDVDLISLDLSSKLPFYIKTSTVSLAISKGIYFEISYSKSIHDLNARKNLVLNARNLIRATRGKNLIISSNAQNAMHLRGPYDLMNLFALFGLNPDQAKAALTKNCKSLLIQAGKNLKFCNLILLASRRQSSRGSFSVETLTDEIPSWKRQKLS